MRAARRRVASMRLALAAIATALLAGCAAVPTAQLTVFHEWGPRFEDRRFDFRDPEPASLEQRTYRQLVEEAFVAIGFRREPGAPLKMSVQVEERMLTRGLVEAAPAGYLSFGWHSGGPSALGIGFGTPWYPWWPAPYWGPGFWGPGYWAPGYWHALPRDETVYENRLIVEFRATGDGTERVVYEATAVTETLERNLPRAVRALAQAIARDFPGAHGTVRRVELPGG